MKTFNLDQCVGQMLGGCYIEQLLSHGRLSAVYRGRQLNPDRSVALMVFLIPDAPSVEVRQEFCARFLQEAPILMKLRHPHLLPFYGYGEWQGFPYLITPYTTEGSLATRITQQGRWSPASILPLLEQVTVGLEYAHSNGQLHGMLSPANLLLRHDGSFQVAAIGLHHLFQNRGLLPYVEEAENLCLPMVAPRYIAPEYHQEQTITIRSDVYSLGVILVEALSGSSLPNDISAQELLAQLDQYVPASLESVLRRTLALNPAHRFRRMSNLFSAYASLVTAEEKSEQKSQPMDVQIPQMPQPPQPSQILSTVEVRPLEAYYPTYPDRMSSNASFAPDRAGSERSPFSIPKIKTDMQKTRRKSTVRRRQVTAILAGSVVMGIVGVGGLNLAQMLTTKPHTQAAATTNGIGQTGQPANTAVQFIDKRVPEFRQRLLIHLPDGNFVAYKQGCTHTGVLVDYNPTTHMLVCPAHGAIFDPANNGRVVSGPTSISLPKVAIHVTSAGTITVV